MTPYQFIVSKMINDSSFKWVGKMSNDERLEIMEEYAKHRIEDFKSGSHKNRSLIRKVFNVASVAFLIFINLIMSINVIFYDKEPSAYTCYVALILFLYVFLTYNKEIHDQN